MIEYVCRQTEGNNTSSPNQKVQFRTIGRIKNKFSSPEKCLVSGWNDIRLARAGMEGEEDRPIYLEGNNPTYPKGEGSLVIRNIEEKKYPLMKFELS